jgi:hypothetical protein
MLEKIVYLFRTDVDNEKLDLQSNEMSTTQSGHFIELMIFPMETAVYIITKENKHVGCISRETRDRQTITSSN